MINQFKTAVLLTALTGLMLLIGQLIGGPSGLTFAIVFAVLMNFGSYFFSAKIVLMMYRAKEAKENEYPKLYSMVREVAKLAKIPMPKVYIIPSESPNAFATGRNPKNAVVACTHGILNILSENELKGVIAHEISHIKNRDILIATIAATIAGVIGYVAMMARFAAIFGGFRGGDRDGGNMLELLALAILAPLIAVIIQLAISRSREYIADASAAKTLHDSDGLSGALLKLDANIKRNPIRFGSPSTASIFISNPFRRAGLLNMFSTHPHTEARVKKLKELGF